MSVRFVFAFLLVLSGVNVWAEPLSAEAMERARVNYLLNCVSCHLLDGSGAPGKVPDLGEYLGVFAQDPEGRAFLIQVPGASGAPISDQELAEVTNWILYTMNKEQLKDDFKPYTAREVAEYRQSPLLEVEPVREKLVEKISHSYSVKY